MMIVDIVDVEHGACAIVHPPNGGHLAMVDCGHNSTTGWRPSTYIRQVLNRTTLDYLFITNADQDHFSDLANLNNTVDIQTLHFNPTLPPDKLRRIKLDGGDLTDDAETYLWMREIFNGLTPIPFDQGMGGITMRMFWNNYPTFIDTNNLSLVVFVRYGAFKILFPGDLEAEGWDALLRRPDFVQELAGTTILLAPHHGRSSAYCPEPYNHCGPMAVVVSDKSRVHDTQDFDYGCVVSGDGVPATYPNGQTYRRKVLTTRADGSIRFRVNNAGTFWINTSR